LYCEHLDGLEGLMLVLVVLLAVVGLDHDCLNIVGHSYCSQSIDHIGHGGIGVTIFFLNRRISDVELELRSWVALCLDATRDQHAINIRSRSCLQPCLSLSFCNGIKGRWRDREALSILLRLRESQCQKSSLRRCTYLGFRCFNRRPPTSGNVSSTVPFGVSVLGSRE
jgi:hypothetical protein